MNKLTFNRAGGRGSRLSILGEKCPERWYSQLTQLQEAIDGSASFGG